MFEQTFTLQINTCDLTSSPEKYICINLQCSEIQDQSFGCYECLIKKHNQIDQLHFDDIIEITTFLSLIKQKQKIKIDLLDKLIKECDSKKQLAQQQIIEDENILNNDQLQQRIEQHFNNNIKKLQNEKDLIKLAINYSDQQYCKLLKLYHEDIEQYEKQIDQKEFKLNVDEILEKHQTVTLQQFNKLKNQMQKLQDENQQQQLQIEIIQKQFQAQSLRDQQNQKRNQCIQRFMCLLITLLFLMLFLIFKEIQHLNYPILHDFDSKSSLKQINQTNQYWIISEILENRSVKEFQNFILLYDKSFNQTFTQDLYEQISLKVFLDNKDRIVCIGAKQKQNLKLIGCDLASEVFSITQNAYSARKSKNGEIYWYWVQSKSFGFSPNKNIVLNNIDQEDPLSEFRFSYGTTNNKEDRRIGSKKGYDNTKEYNLVIYMLDDNK